MVDAVMDETAHVQLVVAAQAIRVNNTVRHDFLFDNSQDRKSTRLTPVTFSSRMPSSA